MRGTLTYFDVIYVWGGCNVKWKDVITIYNTDVKQLYIPRKFEIFCEHDRREGSLRFENFRGM